MGSGKHEDQVDQRFDQGTPEWTREKEGCGGPGVSLASYGSYELWGGEDGIELKADGELLGTYFGADLLGDDRALLMLDKGMLLEVTEEGAREVLSESKAVLLSLVVSDGSLMNDRERGHYYVRFGSKSDELLDLFKDCMVDTYGLPPGKYQKKDREHFFEMIKGSKKAVEDIMKYTNKRGDDYWTVPVAYMDRAAARAYLKGFMSGDGSIGYYPDREGLRVRFFSNNRQGLQQIADLMEEHFGFRTKLYPLEEEGLPEETYNTLELANDGSREGFIIEIGSFKKSHQEVIDRFWRDWG
jgi:hypothetical protein